MQYIEDSYCEGDSSNKSSKIPNAGDDAADAKEEALQSLDSAEDNQPASGIFIEDSYVDPSSEFKEKENEEKMEKEIKKNVDE